MSMNICELRPELDVQLWQVITAWLADDCPFERVAYAERAIAPDAGASG